MGSWEQLGGGKVLEERKGKNSVEKVSYRVVRIGWRKRNGLSRIEAEIKMWGKET